jgi:hypothetical protein
MIDKKTVAKYLAQGIPTQQVAAAVGCEESYISQLRADPEIVAMIAELTVAITTKDVDYDERMNSAEEKALERIEKSLGFANFSQALAAFRTLNNARRRKDGPVTANVTNLNVTLTLPASAIPRYLTNSQNEIIEVEGKTLVSATPASLEAVMAARMGDKLKPAISHDMKGAERLGALMPLPPRSPRKLPTALTPDML